MGLPALFLDAFYASTRGRILLTACWASHPICVEVGGDKYAHVGLLVTEFPILVTNKARPVTAAAPAKQRDRPAALRRHLLHPPVCLFGVP
jgi:hypothetical protein